MPSVPCPGLVVGVGAGRGVSVGEVTALIRRTLEGAGLSVCQVVELATVEAKAAEPGLVAAAARLGVPLRGHGAAALASVAVPNPSGAALTAVGTPGVAEAAALLAAGPGGELLVAKRKSEPRGRPARATCAVARRLSWLGSPPGCLGPCGPQRRGKHGQDG
ncbi:cobalamin biosynthesis protein [Streptomyces sp. ME19-01-6]|uniref:cobalamin biosynthesis protein n=1 Tax=Streptomyces sp. ME19-01-6 TaxID=3028686 RepID=UPI0029A14D16|nr:cobalamin biosynthesis protein [Streptomyces sp. ME19-01-6]MDX3231677.1 cobalamin biosynthesis protein [Streptomyces sp. ME19-01-6]